MKKNTRTHGFTLIELLVAITVMMLVTGGAIAGFMQFSERRQAEQAARDVQQLFVIAQQKASVRDTPAGCLTGTPLQGYRVNYDAANRRFRLLALCAATPPPPALPNTIPASFTTFTVANFEDVIIPAQVTVTAGATNFNFYTLERGTSEAADRTYTFARGTGTFSFTVRRNGSITDVE